MDKHYNRKVFITSAPIYKQFEAVFYDYSAISFMFLRKAQPFNLSYLAVAKNHGCKGFITLARDQVKQRRDSPLLSVNFL